MSNASLKEQLEAVASRLSDKKNPSAKKKFQSINKNKPKPRWLEYVQYGVELLKVYFPEGFKSGNEIKPLKKGIKQDLVKRLSTINEIVTEDKACMVKSLAYYVNTTAYHKSVQTGNNRVDLDGNHAGVVSPEEAAYSTDRFQSKLQSKKSATSPTPAKTPSSSVEAVCQELNLTPPS